MIINLARAALIIGTFFLLNATSVAIAQDSEYYYVGDERVPLRPSNSYRAFKVSVEGGASGLRALRRHVSKKEEAEQAPLLDKYNIILVPAAGPSSMRALRDIVRGAPETRQIESEPPVYDLDGTDQILVNEFLVQFENGVPEQQAQNELMAAGAQITEQPLKITGRYKITFPNTNELQALTKSNALHESPTVKFSQPNFIRILPATPQTNQRERQGTGIPTPAQCAASLNFNDPLFSCQWALKNVKAVEAWRTTTGSSTIIVAILDEGVDTSHPELREAVVTPYDAVDGDDDQTPLLGDAHGTACAGIVGAKAKNGLGVVGIAPGVKIMPVRIATGETGSRWVTTDQIIEDGIRTAADRGAHVLSNSWGGGGPSNAITSGFEYALSKGRTIVIAAGNKFSSVSYPANLSISHDIIAVSATNEADEFKSPKSSDGEYEWGSNHGPQISISAPGVHIPTSDIAGTGGYSPDDYTLTFNGTSSATPHVAGAAALVLSIDPTLTPAQVRDILQRSADDLGEPGFDEFFGYGRLNVEQAVQMAQKNLAGRLNQSAPAAAHNSSDRPK